MKPERHIKVFLSSTFLDLKGHRQQILRSMMRIPWVDPCCMEYEVANDSDLLEHCLQGVSECQVYIGLVGSRYGSTVEDWRGRLSLTEREFDHASRLRLYRILLLSPRAPKGSADDPYSQAQFREKVQQHYIDYFDENEEKSACEPVAAALWGIWHKLDARMLIGVKRSHDMYERDPEKLVALREAIAHDAGLDEVAKVWLIYYSAPTPRITFFLCLLPSHAKDLYLRKVILRRGGVHWALEFRPHDPRFPYIPEALNVMMSLLVTADQYAGLGSILSTLAGERPVRKIVSVSSPSAGDFYLSKARASKGGTDMNGQEEPKSVSASPRTTDRPGSGVGPPMIAFFGTKGGVGKTTIMDKCATLIARGSGGPKVLLVDFDVHHRGLTVLRTKDEFGPCRTIHEYLADPNLEFSGARDVTPPGDATMRGRQYLVPASNLAAKHVFATLADASPPDLLQRIREILTGAVEAYAIDVVLIDCGPIVDPLTASAAHLAEMAFIIGQNEPISFQALQNYAIRIRDFFPDYDASSVRVILNKVRGPVFQMGSIYAAIPFTMEVVDYSEGLPNIDELRLVYLEYCVYGILKQIFEERYPKLAPGPEVVLTENQRKAIDLIDAYPRSRWYSRLTTRRHALTIGCIAAVLGVFLLLIPDTFLGQPSAAPGRDQGLPGTQSPFESGEPGNEYSSSSISEVSRLHTYVPWGGGVLIIIGLVLACVGGFWWRRHKQAAGIVHLKQLAGYEGLLELLTSRAGRQKFTAIHSLSQRTEKEATQ